MPEIDFLQMGSVSLIPYFFTKAGLRRNRVKYEQMGNCLQHIHGMCQALLLRPTETLFNENCERPIA
jgi:hypothetical protein